MKLLMLNDEVFTADTMKEKLDWASCGIDDVRLAYNVACAKEILECEKIDIALLDIEMPGENGLDLLRWMRERGMDAEVIFLTCHASFAYAQEALKLGCQDYILMPSRYEDIAAAISKVVLRHQRQQEEKRMQEYGEQWFSKQKEDTQKLQGDKRKPAQVVADCVAYIRENLSSQELNVNYVANHFYLNPSYISRIFKREKGMGISQFIIQEKMELAAKLLADQTLTAQAVAWKVGYPSYPHFSVTFKKHFGISPQKYQEQHME